MKVKSGFAGLLITLFSAGMVFAQDVPDKQLDPYFQLRFQAGVTHTSSERNVATTGQNDTDFSEKVMVTSRAGLKGQNGKIKGHLEIGLKGNTDANALYLRHLYGTYDAGFATLLIGQTYNPYYMPSSCVSDDLANNGFGSGYDGRLPQIKLTKSNAYIAFIEPSTSNALDGSGGALAGSSIDVFFPKTAIGYEFKTDMIDIGPGIAYNGTKVNDPTSTVDGEWVHSVIGYVHGKVRAGDFNVQFNGYGGINTGDFGISGVPTSNAAISGTSLENTVAFAGYVELGYNISGNILTIGSGGAYAKNDVNDKADSQYMIFGQICMPVEKNFIVSPNVVYKDYLKSASGAKQGREVFGGLKFQYNL